MRRRKGLWPLVAGLLVLIGASVLALWPRPAVVTPENFARIRVGMTLSEVETILGAPGDYTTGPVKTKLASHTCEVLVAQPRNMTRSHPGPEFSSCYLWHGDGGRIAVRFDSSGKAVIKDYWLCDLDPQHPLENLLWRAKRRWRRCFTEKKEVVGIGKGFRKLSDS